MPINTSDALDILAQYDIYPDERSSDGPDVIHPEEQPNFPDVGEVRDDESIYSTDDLGEIEEQHIVDPTDERIRVWLRGLAEIVETRSTAIFDNGSRLDGRLSTNGAKQLNGTEQREAPEPACAWYQPMHFFGTHWGIYIRESCVLHIAHEVATIMSHRGLIKPIPFAALAVQVLRAGFYALFLHEQFHHKVESAGFRMLINSKVDRYRPYKTNVYRPTYLTKDCLEESLANADSYNRLGEDRYLRRLDPETRKGLRLYLRAAFNTEPPGYREGLNYLRDEDYNAGLRELQSRLLDGKWPASTPTDHWTLAPYQVRSLSDIDDEIYVLMPRGVKPLFSPKFIDPGVVISSAAAIKGLQGKGYTIKQGAGKGSHIRLEKRFAPSITIPGNRNALSPGVLKSILRALGGGALCDVRDVLLG